MTPVFKNMDSDQRTELWAALALRRTRGIGANTARNLLDFFGSAYAAVRNAAAWGQLEYPPSQAAQQAFTTDAWRAEAGLDWAALRGSDCGILLWTDPDYPTCLKEIADAPVCLYFHGDKTLLRNPALAVVGARECTREGESVAAMIAGRLSRSGVTVVSGMAMGIDRVAHLAALEGPGSSIAVLASGVDSPTPKRNGDLYALLRRRGLLLSEEPPGIIPRPGSFPVRNRIISGLSRGILVIEASNHSGTLSTARHATEQNRDVFAVPGSSLAETSEGCRDLIRRGAKVVFSAEDILLELAPILRASAGTATAKPECPEKITENSSPPATAQEGRRPWEKAGSDKKSPLKNKGDSEVLPVKDEKHKVLTEKRLAELAAEERVVLRALDQEKKHVDELCRKLEMDVAKLSGVLTMLEVKGFVRRFSGMYYAAKAEQE